MTVKELKKLLKGVADDMEVLIPTSMQFDGIFISPCIGESGVSDLGVDEESDETIEQFMIVPHGFFAQHPDFTQAELN